MRRYALVLLAALAATWWVLSGYTKPLLLTLGGISLALVLLITARMKIFDRETAPYLSMPRTLIYFVWLFKEIIKANIAVIRAVLSPDLTVSPTMTRVPLKNRCDLAKTMFANSITLTPGTVSVDIEDDHILVHALLSEMSAPEDFAEMGEKSAWSVGDPEGRDAS